MQRHDPAIACSVAPANQESKKPSMASQKGAAPTRRSAAGHEIVLTDDSPAPEDFEFRVLSSGRLALAGDDAADMCAADEVFSGGKLLPLRLSSAASSDAPGLLLLRSDSLDGAATAASSSGAFSSRSSSRGASSSSSSSSSVSRSTSSKSASSSDPASLGSLSNRSASSSLDAVAPRRPSLSNSAFYAHPSPSPRPPRRSGLPAAPRRSTGSVPPAAWGVIRLGVVGAPEVYPRRAPADSSRKVAAARGGSQSARFEQASAAAKEVNPVDKKKLGLFGAGLVCSCSPDAVAPVGTVQAPAAEARRRRKKAEDKKKRTAKQSGQSTSRRSRILDWLEEHSKPRTKSVV